MPMANGAASAVGSPLPKWQLALAVSAPVALGLGYMYYRNSASKTDQGKSKDGGKSNGTGDKQISIDGEFPNKTTAESVPETPTERAQRYKSLGNDKFKAGKYEEAIAQYDKAIETCPRENRLDLATFYQNRAAAWDQLSRYKSVIEDCTKALIFKPEYSKALIRRARALEKIGDMESALEDLTTACVLENYENGSTLQCMDRLLRALGQKHAVEYWEKRVPIMPSSCFIKSYINSFSRNPFEQKTSETDTTVDESSEALRKAYRAVKEQKYDNVVPICTKELEREGKKDAEIEMQVRLLRATFYIILSQLDEALTDLSTVIDSEHSNNTTRVNALIQRGNVFMQKEKSDECFEDYKKAAEIDPDCPDIYHHRAQLYLLLERLDEAKHDAAKSLSLNPEFGIGYAQMCYTYYRYAVTKRSVELIDAAVKKFEKGFDKFPECSEIHTLYAQVLADSQDYGNADAHFLKAISKDPENSTILVHRAFLQIQYRSDVEKAVELTKQALEVDDKCVFALETYATIEVQRGNLEEAVKLFEKALTLSRSISELTHLFSLKDAAVAQLKVIAKLGHVRSRLQATS